jgi:hypothetical protein
MGDVQIDDSVYGMEPHALEPVDVYENIYPKARRRKDGNL